MTDTRPDGRGAESPLEEQLRDTEAQMRELDLMISRAEPLDPRLVDDWARVLDRRRRLLAGLR